MMFISLQTISSINDLANISNQGSAQLQGDRLLDKKVEGIQLSFNNARAYFCFLQAMKNNTPCGLSAKGFRCIIQP